MRDWHAERYVAGEALAKTARDTLSSFREVVMFIPTTHVSLLDRLETALAEYDRTRDAP